MGQPALHHATPPHGAPLEALRARLDARFGGSLVVPGGNDAVLRRSATLSVSPEFDALFGDSTGGLPRGAVVELSAAFGFGRATSLALAACASAQVAQTELGEASAIKAWCAWIDPSGTLQAPAVRAKGVDLERLLVVRPKLEDTLRATTRLVEARAFALVVVDLAALPGARALPRSVTDVHPNVVRRLSLACEGSERTVLLLTDGAFAGGFRAPLPVAMRVELTGIGPGEAGVKVTKDRRGRHLRSTAARVRVA